MMDVLENKNVPGNGLTDTVSPEEMTPLKKKKKAYREEMMDIGPDGDEDRGGRIGGGIDSGDRLSKTSSMGRLESWAYKCRLSPKRGLIYLIVCAIIIFILLFVVIILAASWPSDSNRATCNSPQCHLFSAKILSGLNETTSPCEDFWEFGCGGWLSRNPIPRSKSHWSTEEQEQFKIKEKLRSLINTIPFSDQSSSVEMKVKRFYQTCVALQYIEPENEKPLKRVIQQLGGWQVFHTFRANDFDFPRVLKRLQGEWRTSPFFHIDVVPDPRGPSRNIIRISPSGLSLPDRSYYFKHEEPIASAFRTFAKDVLQLLGATSNVASQIADEIFYFEKRIAEITPDVLDLRDPVQTFKKMTVSQLKSQSNTIFWADLLKSLFPQANVNDLTEVLVVSEQYLVDISSIISTTDKGNLNNYLMWHLTHKYLPYLSKAFRDVYDIYQKEATGSVGPTPRWEFCIDESLKIFPHVFNALLSENCEDRGNKTLKIETMFEAMKATLQERFDSGLKYNETMKNFALDKLKLMGIQVGTPLTNRTILNDMYFALDFQHYDFFSNIQYATDFALNQLQRQLANPAREARILETLAKSPFDVVFVPSSNKIIVPESFLQKDVLLLDNSHLPLIYGSAGIQLAEAIASAYGIELGLYWSNGALMTDRDPKVQETRNLIESKRSCLASFFTNIRLDDEPYIERTSLDTTIHLGGIQIAYDTLKNQAEYEAFTALPSLQSYEHNAVFFISYVQSQCSTHTLLYHDLEHSTFTSLSHDHRTKGLLRQFVPFTDAFSCSSRQEMFADFTCAYVI